MLIYCDNCQKTYHYYNKPLKTNLCNKCAMSQQSRNLNRKRSYVDLRKSENEQDFIASSSNSNLDSDKDVESRISLLNREISDLYQQIKQRKEEIENLKIERAVKKAKLETEQRVRRESNKWLPTLNKITDVQKEIISNLSSDSDDNDSESDDIDKLIMNTSAEALFDKICNENLHKNN